MGVTVLGTRLGAAALCAGEDGMGDGVGLAAGVGLGVGDGEEGVGVGDGLGEGDGGGGEAVLDSTTCCDVLELRLILSVTVTLTV